MDTSRRSYAPINFADKLAQFADRWQPRVIAELNDYQFKISSGTITPRRMRPSSCSTVRSGSIFAMDL